MIAAHPQATLAADIISGRPGLSRTLWRVAVSTRKKIGGDPARALGVPLRAGPVRLRPAEITAYASLCGFALDGSVPITFPHMLAFPLHTRIMARDAFPFPVMGAIHVENSIEQHAPLHAGDVIDLEAAPTALLRHGKGQVVELTTRVWRADTLVWESRSLYLFRGTKTAVGEAYASALAPARADTADDRVGVLQERARWPLPASIGRSYAILSGDWNPIHISRLTARLFGMRKSIAHGMWMKARAIAAVTASTEGIASVTVAFSTPAFLPGGARVFASSSPAGLFEVRDALTPRRLLRGCLRLRV